MPAMSGFHGDGRAEFTRWPDHELGRLRTLAHGRDERIVVNFGSVLISSYLGCQCKVTRQWRGCGLDFCLAVLATTDNSYSPSLQASFSFLTCFKIPSILFIPTSI